MKESLLTLAVFSLLMTACGLNSPNVDATVAAQVAATMQAQPPQQVPVEVPVTVQVPVEVPVTVVVEVTSAVQPTQVVQPAADTPTPLPPPASAATSAPVVSVNPQDPLAGCLIHAQRAGASHAQQARGINDRLAVAPADLDVVFAGARDFDGCGRTIGRHGLRP